MTNFIVMDMETTGNVNQELVHYCGINHTENEQLKPVVCFDMLLDILPEENILPAATALHGISNFAINEVKNNPNEVKMYFTQKEAYQNILHNLIRVVKENIYIIGYNHINFDFHWLRHNIIRYLIDNKDEKQIDKLNKLFDVLTKRSLDVFLLARKLYSKTDLGDLSLSSVYIHVCCKNDKDVQKFLQRRTIHDAETDCYLTLEILNAIAKDKFGMLADHDILTNEEIETLIEKLNTPVLILDKPLDFGKYKGKTFEEIYYTDTGYIEWLAHNCKDIDVQYTAREVLKKGYKDLIYAELNNN